MIDLNDILENDQVKSILQKVGVTDDQAKKVAKEGVQTIQKNYKKDPNQVSSLLSDNPNTEDDMKMASVMENDFVQGIMNKLGLSEGVANQLKGALPGIMNQVTNKLSAEGKNDQNGVGGMFDSIVDLFDGDDDNNASNKKSSGGFMSIIGGLFGRK